MGGICETFSHSDVQLWLHQRECPVCCVQRCGRVPITFSCVGHGHLPHEHPCLPERLLVFTQHLLKGGELQKRLPTRMDPHPAADVFDARSSLVPLQTGKRTQSSEKK